MAQVMKAKREENIPGLSGRLVEMKNILSTEAEYGAINPYVIGREYIFGIWQADAEGLSHSLLFTVN